ncbi:MAG: PepSY-like domain-containing protein [Bacteroides sp.]|nr:PepSY-like domain-containing protein [Bacteroides sp.]
MKKIYLFLMLCVFGCLAWSCGDDDDDKNEPIAISDLPAAAKTFINQFYPDVKVSRVTKESSYHNSSSEYEVVFANGQEVEFDTAGNWTDIDAPKGQVIPTGIMPAIESYVSANYNGSGINEISRELRNYEVELTNGVELLFDLDGNFLGVDRD